MNGLLVVDKPGGITSHDVVAKVRRATGESSIGHLGTLDPLASGVLPLLLGRYTRLAQFFGKLPKAYMGTIRFGFATDTYDADGVATSQPQQVELSARCLEQAAEAFVGEIEQMPPPISAKKIDGKPAYKLARAGQEAALKPARVQVHAFEITDVRQEEADFFIRVSAGGYVRAVAHQMGQQFGCGAHLRALRRVEAGPFTVEQAVALDEVCRRAAAGLLEAELPHPRTLLPELPATTAESRTAGRLRNGGAVNLPEYSAAPMVKVFEGQRDLVAVAKRVAGTLFQPVVVLG